MIFLYNIAIWFFKIGILIASFFSPKARKWIAGRKNIFPTIQSQIPENQQIIWFHCASLGEFEQGRPLIEKIKKELTGHQILLTFFSPSGFEIRKNYEHADYIFYLPIDSKRNAQQFLNIVKPVLAVFVKYEFWYHYLHELKKQKTPTLLISAIFRKDQIFFKSYGQFFKKMLHCFDHIFVQNEFSRTLLLQNNVKPVSLAGDTRVDRVLEISEQAKNFPKVEAFSGTSEVLLCGSTWQPDEEILIPFINEQIDFRWKYIIAPHDIKEANLKRIEKMLSVSSIRYSKANSINAAVAKVLIIDNIGMLSSLYQYGNVAYIGGGFGKGIHNILEPIAFGLPVIFGINYQKFEEANHLVKNGGAFSISNKNELEKVMLNLEKEVLYNIASAKAKNYILENKGATSMIFDHIKENFIPNEL